MKTIIAGSRSIVDIVLVERAIQYSGFVISEVVCGEAAGVDTLGKIWAVQREILVKSFPALWSLHGRSAGPIRNEQMSLYADSLVAVWDGKSGGTKHMISCMKKLNKPYYVLNVNRLQLCVPSLFCDTWSE